MNKKILSLIEKYHGANQCNIQLVDEILKLSQHKGSSTLCVDCKQTTPNGKLHTCSILN